MGYSPYGRICGIYKITNKLNNKSYIGQSNNIQRRLAEHKSENYRNFHLDKPLYKSISKNGIENFSFEIIEQCDENILDEREKYWINIYNCLDNGYNCTEGGKIFPEHQIGAKNPYENNSYNAIVQHICKFEEVNDITDVEGIDESIENMSSKQLSEYYLGLNTVFNDFCQGYNSFDDWAECNL